MNYIQITFCIASFEEYMADVLASQLVEIGFESFELTNEGTIAYIQEHLFNEMVLKQLLADFPLEINIEYEISKIEAKNWNEEWEKNYFEPIVIDNECVIHSSFHKNVPQARYKIIIDPKMSFGTGHHETTSLMISEILNMTTENKNVLDMGCGTAVLAILASMCGAKTVLAIDIDEWCTKNSVENINLNHVSPIEVKTGGVELLCGLHFDIIIANINRNILLADMHKYADCLTKGGKLFMSGFYKEDIPVIEAEANCNSLKLMGFKEKNNWVVVETEKMG
ncbi:MAG: 50S ribosomal protein L11 methyltransferase [Paludibacter sp.]|nr:50S ribosomal protein L11 methyltransferase [Paludibacter sp.]